MRTDFVTVEPHEVCHGDILAGVPGAKDRPIDSILMDGNDGWWIYASQGRILDRRAPWSRVQVVREVVPGEVAPAASPGTPAAWAGTNANGGNLDDCPPHGLVRRHGMYVVVP
jgi:hypothetical protein